MTPRLKEALQEGIRALHVADIASPENDTTVLLAHQLQISVNDLRTKLAIDPETILSTEDYKGFQEYISRRAEHEPLQWIIGYAWFDGHQFMVGPGVFIPRPESEVMLDYILNHTAKFLEPECSFGHDSSLQPKTRILDLCAGSGSIGISALIRLLNRGEILTRLTLVEKSTEAYEYLDKNRDLQIKHPGAYTTAVLGDATTYSVPEEKRFDVIFCNPPYVRSDTPLSPEVLQDPAEALYGEGDDGFDIPRKIIQNLPNLIAKDGYFIIEHMEDQGELAYQALKKTGLNNIKTIDDLTGRPRFTFACWKSGK